MSEQTENPEQKIPPNKTTVRVMAVIIVMLIICIATRWDYVKKEVLDAVNTRFKTEQKK